MTEKKFEDIEVSADLGWIRLYTSDEDYEDYDGDEVLNMLNEQSETIQSLTKEKQYFLKVIFAMGNYAEKGDYERIIDARDKVKQRVLE